MNLFNFFNKEETKKRYYNHILKEDINQLYTFNHQYLNQDKKLLKMYGYASDFDKKINMIVISDTHNALKEEDFVKFVNAHKSFDICLLLGDHHSNDIEKILRYIDKNKIYGLLGNHDYDYLEEYGIKNINGKIITVKNTTILGIEGSFKYKSSKFPSFSQKESILFLNDKQKVDILISHDNSFDSTKINNPAHQGLFGITYYLNKNNIPYHIHGHIHNPYKKDLQNGTKEISVYMFEYIQL